MGNRYGGPERRKNPRVITNFVISYRIKHEVDNYDLSSSKNISQGGMLLTTNRKFEKGTLLAMYIRFPFMKDKIEVTGEVVESKKIVTNLIYETHIKFVSVDQMLLIGIGEYVNEQLRKK